MDCRRIGGRFLQNCNGIKNKGNMKGLKDIRWVMRRVELKPINKEYVDYSRLFKRERVLQYCVEAEGRDVWIDVRVEDEVLPEGGEED